jgi:hypothetical protein
MKKLATADLHESLEYKDIVLRVYTDNGSTPVPIMIDGTIFTAEEIGLSILDLFNYRVKTDLIPPKE